MIELRLLRTFLAVAADASFRKAAEALNLAPSTVTAQVKSLEDELGAAVFDRSGRVVVLTEQGRRLLGHARRLLDLEAEARGLALGGEDHGELSVRVSESLGARCLPEVLRAFRRSFPQTRLTVATASRRGLAEDLARGATDLALILSEPFTGPSLEVEAIGRERLAVIAPPDSRLAGRVLVRPEDLDGVPLFLTRYVWSARRAIEQALDRAHARPAVVECQSVEIVRRCVLAGLGASVVPAFAVEEEARLGTLAVLDWADGPLAASVLLARCRDRRPSPAGTAFMDAARSYWRAPARA